jgi:hypothetical protein
MWNLISMRGENKLVVFGKWLLRRIFAPKMEKAAHYIIVSNFINCSFHQILCHDQIKEDKMGVKRIDDTRR